MSGACTVDADLFDTLQQAVDFVAERGGGVVYTRLAATPFAAGVRKPETVRLEAVRPPATGSTRALLTGAAAPRRA